MDIRNDTTNPTSQVQTTELKQLRIGLKYVTALNLPNAGGSITLPETLPETFEEAGRKFGELNREALTELAKW